MIPRVLCIAVLGLCGISLAHGSDQEGGMAAILRQYVSPSCEIAQPVMLADRGKYASLIVVGTGEEVFSPELGKNDTLAVTSDAPDSILQLARKSGFRVKQNSHQVPLKGGNSQCPLVEESIRTAAQDRDRRRHEVQSKVHHLGSDGVIPPSWASGAGTAATPLNTCGVKAQSSGFVIVETVVSANGSVAQVRVVHSLTAKLDNKAAEAIKNWKFTPATKHGLPVPALIDIEINFHLCSD